jgi:pSer/pThr/pTyr-binding forkhead associated (FHA) protein
MVLVEDMVSRKHAKIVTDDRTVSIQDLGSTNGTFVNGEKIRKVELKDGDRILIGTSIIKLVALDGQTSAMSETEARSKMQVTANKRPVAKSMSGSIEEIPLPDLLQLLSTSRKSGVVALRSDWGHRPHLPAQGSDLLRHHRRELRRRPPQGDVPDAHLEPGLLRARAPRRARGAGGDPGLDRGAVDGGDAAARRVPGPGSQDASAQRQGLGAAAR